MNCKNLKLIASLLALGHCNIIGINPKDADLYKPDANGNWRCLSNPEIEINFDQINDDYCDCPDGSDEPGTSACPNGKFYCENEGHIPSYINSYLVNDGRCDYELCCDGTDEINIDCPNKCEEINEEFTRQEAEKEKIYQAGIAKVKTILKAAKRLRTNLQDDFDGEKRMLRFVDNELYKYKDKVEKLNQKEGKDKKFENKIKSILEDLDKSITANFETFNSNNNYLSDLNKISKGLLETFNPNLNDAAVKKVVDDYAEHLTKFSESYKEHINFNDYLFKLTKDLKYKDIESVSSVTREVKKEYAKILDFNKKIAERISDLELNLNYLINNYNPNFNDPNVKEAVQLFQDYLSNKLESSNLLIEDKIKSINDLVNELKDKLKKDDQLKAELELLEHKRSFIDNLKLKFFKLVDELKLKFEEFVNEFLDSKPLRSTKDDIVNTKNGEANVLSEHVDEFLKELQKNKDDSEARLKELEYELSKDFGPDDILRPFKDVSISAHIGEYDYELFIIGDVKQKGNGDTKIGSYSRYEIKEIDDKNQQFILYYNNGQKCWNGPKRSAIVFIECGDKNEILSVSEPEKCEYHFKVKAPIGCKL